MSAGENKVVRFPQAVRSIFSQATRSLFRQLAVRIQNAVPACSLDCVKTFVSLNYPSAVCPDRESISCLCTHESSSGLTLGEAALRCLFSSCSPVSREDFRVYSLCSGIRNALPNTHSALTVTVATAPSFTTSSSLPRTSRLSLLSAPSTSPDPTMANSLTQTEPSSGGVKTAAPSTVHKRSRSETHSPTVVQGTVLPSATPAPTTSPTRNQIIGMSIAGAAVGAILIVLAVYFFVHRRQYVLRQKDQDDDFEIGGPMSEPQKPDLPVPPLLAPCTPIGRYNQPIVRHLPPMLTVKEYRAPKSTLGAQQIAGSTEYVHDSHSMSTIHSPTTPNSASRLLPNKADYAGDDDQRPTDRGSDRRRNRLRKSPRQTQLRGSILGNRRVRREGNDSPYSQGNECRSPAKGSPGSASLIVDRGMPEQRNFLTEGPLSPRRPVVHTLASAPDRSRLPYQDAADSGASLSKTSPNGFDFSQPNQIKHYIDRSVRGDQNNQCRLERADSRNSVSSVTTIETLGSSEMDVVTKIPHRVPTKLSPVRESMSPVPRQYDGHKQGLVLPRAVDRREPSNYPRQSLLRYEQSRRHSRPDSLLTKRRGDSFADNMEKGISVASGKASASRTFLPGNTSVDGCDQFARIPRSQPRSPLPGREELPETGGPHREHGERGSKDLAFPRELKMKPTRDGSNLVLRFE